MPRRGVSATGGASTSCGSSWAGGSSATGGSSWAGAGAAGVVRMGLPQVGQLPTSSGVSLVAQLGQRGLFSMATSPQSLRLKHDAPLKSPARPARNSHQANFCEQGTCELPRTILPRTPVNRGWATDTDSTVTRARGRRGRSGRARTAPPCVSRKIRRSDPAAGSGGRSTSPDAPSPPANARCGPR